MSFGIPLWAKLESACSPFSAFVVFNLQTKVPSYIDNVDSQDLI